MESRKIAGMINFESSVEEIERVITNVMSKEFKGTPSKVDINNPGSFRDIACEIRSEMKNAKT